MGRERAGLGALLGPYFLGERADDLSSLVSHRLNLSDGVAGYELFAARTGGCTKVLLYPD